MGRIEDLFSQCNSTTDLANAAKQLRDEGENVSLINKARMSRLKELVSSNQSSYKRIPKTVFNPVVNTEGFSSLQFSTKLLNDPVVGLAGDVIII